MHLCRVDLQLKCVFCVVVVRVCFIVLLFVLCLGLNMWCSKNSVQWGGGGGVRGISILSEWLHTWSGEGTDTLFMVLYRAVVRSKVDCGCFVYITASNTNLGQLGSFHNTGLRLALRQPPSLQSARGCQWSYFGASAKAVHAVLFQNKCLHDNPAHHTLHDFRQTARNIYYPMPNETGDMTRYPTRPVGLNISK